MTELAEQLSIVDTTVQRLKPDVVKEAKEALEAAGYEIIEQDNQRPWGAFLRIASLQADRFVEEFFPGLSPKEARLGIDGAELSPKILIVTPGQRLSWQLHDRRAERWKFLTPGAYYKSETDEPGGLQHANAGDVVQFQQGERHRLVGAPSNYVIVAEIWQHSDIDNPSDEDDIIRLQDDYQR